MNILNYSLKTAIMKRPVMNLVILLAALAVGCSQKTNDYVLTGQLYSTPSPGFIERINGKAKMMKITNYLAIEENGKFVKGNEFTAENRKTFNNMEPTLMEEYNPAGTILKTVSYDEKGKVTSYCAVEGTGTKIDKMVYYSADTAMANGKTLYNNNLLEEVKYYHPKNDTLYMSIRYEYDPNGNRTKLQTYDYKGQPGAYSLYKYNEKGFLVQVQQYNKSGKLTGQTDITRGDKGERLTTRGEVFGTNSRVVNYTFENEFDKMNNWIKLLIYVDGKPLIIRERKIEYYE
jgi:hypothetical protein